MKNQSVIFNEGLHEGDLNNLILPIISIDEFHSKIDDDKNIVVCFYVKDLKPAQDLSRFIQKSEIPLNDTDISKTTNEEGNYEVFIEFRRNKKFPEYMNELMDSVKGLTNVLTWKMKCYKIDKIEKFNSARLSKIIRLEVEK